MSEYQHPSASTDGENRFFTWLRGLGISRSDSRWFAGVAAGIATKAGIDPLIVRGVFVVLAVLGGPGILLYLAGWLLLPDASGRIHVEEMLRGRASAGIVIASVVLGVVLVIPAVFWMLRMIFAGPLAWDVWHVLPDWLAVTFGVLWWAIAVPGAIVWLIIWLNGRRSAGGGAAPGAPSTESSTAPQPATATTAAAPTASEPTSAQPNFSQRADDWGRNFEQKAQEWGRNAEQRGREWEARHHELLAQRRLGAAHIVISIALALLAAGATAAAVFTAGVHGAPLYTASLIAAVAVLALSSIVAGIRGRNSGWVGFLSLCGVVTLVFAPFSTVMPPHTDFVPFGNTTIRALEPGEDQSTMLIAGNGTVDLSELDRFDDPQVIDLWMLAGNAKVIMPDRANARAEVQVLAGIIKDQRREETERRGGVFLSRDYESTTTTASEDTVLVRVHLFAGNIRVTHD